MFHDISMRFTAWAVNLSPRPDPNGGHKRTLWAGRAQTPSGTPAGRGGIGGEGARHPGWTPAEKGTGVIMSTMIAAPTTATMLGDYGADVVKVEMPGTGDFVRRFGAQKDGQGLYWKTLSRGKRSVALDLRRPEARELMLRWVRQFDVLVENFRPGTLERWGLDPVDLRAANPRLVVLRVTAYGQDGPYRERPGFGTLAEALAGLASVSGYDDRPPLLPAYPLADIMAGNLGATAVLAALQRRDRTGTGDTIDLAIYEAALKLVEINVLEYQQTGREHGRTGNRYGPAAPRGSYECRDGLWIALSGSP
jgi:crotonobetainyl-CoA:carnitine CoA-transferase CaiB-like acyl-CoA transferase